MRDEDERLFEFLRGVISKDAREGHGVALPPFVGADPHLLASLVQKAIRRSDCEVASRAGFQLLRTDRRRLWRRLMVTALEDIGLGNLDAAIALVAASASAQGRRQLGGEDQVLRFALHLACDAIKDRAGDCVVPLVKEVARSREVEGLKRASADALQAVIGSSHLGFLYRVRAALILCGREPEQDGYPSRTGPGLEALFEAFDGLGVPPLLLAACRLYARKLGDPLPVLLPCLWAEFNKEKRTSELIHQGLRAPLIGGIPAYGMDPLHTRVGRQAIEQWIRSSWRPVPWSARQLAIAVWNRESAACRKTLLWRFGDDLRLSCHRAELIGRGLSEDRHRELEHWVTREEPALLAARTIIWERLYLPLVQTREADPSSKPS